MKKVSAVILAALLILCTLTTALAEDSSLKMSPESVIELLEQTYKSDDVITYTIKHDDENDIYFIYVLTDGATYIVYNAMNGGNTEDWQTVSDAVMDLNTSAYDIVKAATGNESSFVVTLLVNDLNPDNVLLSILNGVKLTDALTDNAAEE